eukprot:2204244-Prorocentrum_lima.AAC.1
MTSSLVGSEMCIRDSSRPLRQQSQSSLQRVRGGEPHGELQLDQEMRAERPVSYTHLTLPTICSV